MRKYLVRIAAAAEQSLQVHARFIAVDKPEAAEKWFKRILLAISKLERMPRQHPPVKRLSAQLGVEVRRLVMGSYVAYFTINEDLRVIEIIAFRHGARERE